jgi:hypothetical protein
MSVSCPALPAYSQRLTHLVHVVVSVEQASTKEVSVVAQKQVQKKARAILLIYGLSQRNIAACIAELSTLCMNRSSEVIGAALREWLYKLPDWDSFASA